MLKYKIKFIDCCGIGIYDKRDHIISVLYEDGGVYVNRNILSKNEVLQLYIALKDRLLRQRTLNKTILEFNFFEQLNLYYPDEED